MPDSDLFVGVDVGTSGARAVVIDAGGDVVADGSAGMADGDSRRDPEVWWRAVEQALGAALRPVDGRRVRGLAVDGTSGTMLAVDADGAALSDGIMYNEPCTDRAVLDRIAEAAPAESAAHGASSALARALILLRRHPDAQLAHQADWIASRFSGRIVSDENNALKTGYDPIAGTWPGWIETTALPRQCLPEVLPAASPVGSVTASAAERFGLGRNVLVVTGSTDGCASFLATGASAPGEACTALGTTLVLKILADAPIFAPEYGIYSHRILGKWLAGGSSNSGGGALLAHFPPQELRILSERVDPEAEAQFDYYPLPKPGERFPIADAALAPRVMPRPDDDVAFLGELLHGIARIERDAYRRLAELGAPPLKSVRSVGGGAGNRAWTRIRQRYLGVAMPDPAHCEAAYGTALLARQGAS